MKGHCHGKAARWENDSAVVPTCYCHGGPNYRRTCAAPVAAFFRPAAPVSPQKERGISTAYHTAWRLENIHPYTATLEAPRSPSLSRPAPVMAANQ